MEHLIAFLFVLVAIELFFIFVLFNRIDRLFESTKTVTTLIFKKLKDIHNAN